MSEKDVLHREPVDGEKVISGEEKRESHHHHHHSSHHHHSHHHRKHRKRSSNDREKKNAFVSFLKEHKTWIINAVFLLVILVLLVLLAWSHDGFLFGGKSEESTNITENTVQIETSVFTKKQLLVSEAIPYYLDPNNTETVTEVYKAFGGSKSALNVGRPVTVMYYVTGLPAGAKAVSAVLELSENEDLSDALKYSLDLANSKMDVYNLKTGTKYYYRITLTLDPAATIGTIGSFETEASPRIMNIEGGYNLRDIGGWKTTDGGVLRQGLLYRGCEIDGAVEEKYTITDRGLQQMIGDLGIRFDMDLRSSAEVGEKPSALGKNVLHKYYGVDMYKGIFPEKQASILREIFSDLADPANYPIYMHCTYGRDRSGTICYLLEALLGVSDEDLLREYELSAFTDSYVNRADFDEFVSVIQAMEGNTTKEKVEGFLLSVGVTPEEIASLRAIYLEQE